MKDWWDNLISIKKILGLFDIISLIKPRCAANLIKIYYINLSLTDGLIMKN